MSTELLVVGLERLTIDELEAHARAALDALRERTRAPGDDDARRHHADGRKCIECLASWARVRSAANDNAR